MRRLLLVGIVVVLAGCAAPGVGGNSIDGTVGEVDGVTHNKSLAITPEDGFNETERDRLVRRSMARIEVVRGLEFKRMVELEVIARQTYREQRANRSRGEEQRQWDNQIWEGLFIVGEDRDVNSAIDQTFGESVQGYYLPGRDRIVIVSDSETPTISKRTLVHELVHALQDQQFGLNNRPETEDGKMARNSVVEGEASLLPRLYFDRCDGEWSCIRPDTSGDSSDREIDQGIFQMVIYPYSRGPNFVDQFRQEGGWTAVDTLHDRLPETTEQVLHPDSYPDEEPLEVTVSDQSTDEWSRLDFDPPGERLGEAAIFSMFATNDVVATDPRSYRDPVSAGWGGDKLVPYRSDDGEFGYVWELAWDSETDAQEFHEAYLALLEDHGAVEERQGVYVVPDGPFEDAFRVTLDGQRVRIVNAPAVEKLSAIHGS